jgi:hypothetical protein
MLKNLAKKHSLSNKKQEKTVIYIKDLIKIKQTNLITTKKEYLHGRHQI